MQITAQTLAAISGRPANENMQSAVKGLQLAGVGAGLERPHRLAMYLGQIAHESMGWHYDREVWGPTAAQKRYDGRTDLGNTAALDGDGFLYRGRGPIQITGKHNYQQFTAWARRLTADAPDFVMHPDAVNTDPWEGLGPVWYWDWRNLNVMADRGDYETLTRRINGGLNGLKDRQEQYARAALVLMGRSPDGVRGYQAAVGLKADGIVGPKTIASLHKALLSMPPVALGVPVIDAVRPQPKPATTAGQSPLIAIIIGLLGAVAVYLGVK